jgi:HK97 family phage major capsid protein
MSALDQKHMDPKDLKTFEDKLVSAVDAVLEEKLARTISPVVASETKKIVEQLRLERMLYGHDRSGLSDEQKTEFVRAAKAIANGTLRAKANEELIEEQDSRGGFLVSVDVANAIQRIAASVGLVLSQAQKWSMKTDELDIPAYTGAFLEGEYLGANAAGALTAIAFDQARLIAKKWQLAFAVGNDLLTDASVNLADWLLALGAEALANRVDKEGFNGTGSPFVGVLNHGSVPVFTLAAGHTSFSSFDIGDASDAIAQVEEAALDGAAFFFHRTVWAKIRSQKDTAGNYIFGYSNTNFGAVETPSGIKPQGYILGFPVYTTRHLPANSASASGTKFGMFGNLKEMAYGDKGELRVAQAQAGTFGGKEIALADQTGLIYKHRHALVLTLPAAFVSIKTA